MEQKDFDIYEILKGVPVGTKLYTPMCGKVGFAYLATNKEAGEVIWTSDKNGEHTFNKNGRWIEGGEVMLFPSDKMRDWSKFAWKKGDVLVTEDGNAHIIFEKFTDDTYTIFAGKYYYCKNGKKGYTYLRECDNAITEEFTLETEDAAKTFIGFIEKRLGGKLNRETLEVEETKKPVFELGNLYVFNEQDEDGELTPFKPFDKVLVSNGEGYKWHPAFFVSDRGEGANYRYKVFSIQNGRVADFSICIPYEGNEHLAFTSDPF